MPWSRSWTITRRPASPGACSSRRTGNVQGSPFRFPGIASELDRGLRLGVVTKLLSPLITAPQAGRPPAGWTGSPARA